MLEMSAIVLNQDVSLWPWSTFNWQPSVLPYVPMQSRSSLRAGYTHSQQEQHKHLPIVIFIGKGSSFWGHLEPCFVASLTPVHGLAGSGAAKRRSPTGGSAYGIPTNRSATWPESSSRFTSPRTWPVENLTTGPEIFSAEHSTDRNATMMLTFPERDIVELRARLSKRNELANAIASSFK